MARVLNLPIERVSIHAPARGATSFVCVDTARLGVSIHAPARGATIALVAKLCRKPCFNPRAREGRDRKAVI